MPIEYKKCEKRYKCKHECGYESCFSSTVERHEETCKNEMNIDWKVGDCGINKTHGGIIKIIGENNEKLKVICSSGVVVSTHHFHINEFKDYNRISQEEYINDLDKIEERYKSHFEKARE